jgi:esterase/lipase superfamily enzyme
MPQENDQWVLTLNAIEVLANGRRSVLSRVNQVILAAADVDSNLMPNLGKYVVDYCKRTTSYVCGDDLALRVSGWVHGYTRIGFRPPTFVLGGMDTIVVNDKDLGDFAHGYIGKSRDVLNDVFALLKGNTPPSERFSVESVVEGARSYWRLKD